MRYTLVGSFKGTGHGGDCGAAAIFAKVEVKAQVSNTLLGSTGSRGVIESSPRSALGEEAGQTVARHGSIGVRGLEAATTERRSCPQAREVLHTAKTNVPVLLLSIVVAVLARLVVLGPPLGTLRVGRYGYRVVRVTMLGLDTVDVCPGNDALPEIEP